MTIEFEAKKQTLTAVEDLPVDYDISKISTNGSNPTFANHAAAALTPDGVFLDFRTIAPNIGVSVENQEMIVRLSEVLPHTRIFLTRETAKVFFSSLEPLLKELIKQNAALAAPEITTASPKADS